MKTILRILLPFAAVLLVVGACKERADCKGRGGDMVMVGLTFECLRIERLP